MAENNTLNTPEISPEEEAKLQKMASRRTGFKKHLAFFVLLNTFLWVVWFFLFRDSSENTFLMAILFVLIVWILIISLHYLIVYKWTMSYKEKELTSLKKMRLRQLQEIEKLKAEMLQKEDTTSDDGQDGETSTDENTKNESFFQRNIID
jgi:hypothetical protein